MESKRKVKQGIVVSNKMDKTVVVKVSQRMAHPRYGKVIVRSKRYYAHTTEKLPVGTLVSLVETRPLSKMKRWRIEAVLAKPEQVETVA